MKLNRKRATLKKMMKDEECFVKTSPRERVAFMWELTSELWSLRGSEYVKRRLQRNVTNLIKQ